MRCLLGIACRENVKSESSIEAPVASTASGALKNWKVNNEKLFLKNFNEQSFSELYCGKYWNQDRKTFCIILIWLERP